jgi:hypothetical protein
LRHIAYRPPPTAPAETGLPSIYEATYVALSSTPNADGRQWVYLRASDDEEASIIADTLVPTPRYLFKLPTQRTKAVANMVLRFGPFWIIGTIGLVTYLTIHFRRSGLGFVVLGWAQSFGFALLLLATVILLVVSYLAALDVACSRAGSRALKARAKRDPDGTLVEPQALEDILEAYGPVRMSRAVRRVNVAFALGMTLVVLAANFFR